MILRRSIHTLIEYLENYNQNGFSPDTDRNSYTDCHQAVISDI